MFAQIFAAEFNKGERFELAVFVIILHPLGQDVDRHSIDIIFLPPMRAAVCAPINCTTVNATTVDYTTIGAGSVIRVAGVGRHGRAIRWRRIDLLRVPIKGRIFKEVGDIAKVHDSKPALALCFVNARAPANDLLELGHRVDGAVKDNQLTGLGIDPRGHELGGGGDHRIGFLRRNKVIQFRLAHRVVAGDAHDIAPVFMHQVAIHVGNRMTHPCGVVNILTEDDRLLIASALFEILGDAPGDHLGALVNHQGAVKITRFVESFGNRDAIAVQFIAPGLPAIDIAVQVDANHLVGGEETIGNALFERVGVHGFAKIVTVGDRACLLGRGGQAELGGAGKIVKHLAPGRVGGGAAAMTFINDNQIKEIGRKLAVAVLPLFRARDALVERQIDLKGFVDLATGDLGHLVAKVTKVVGHGLVGQNVAVNQKEHPLDLAGAPEPPDDLKGGVGLAGAGRHYQQKAALSLGNRLDRAVDGHHLIVARGAATAVKEVIFGYGVGHGRL